MPEEPKPAASVEKDITPIPQPDIDKIVLEGALKMGFRGGMRHGCIRKSPDDLPQAVKDYLLAEAEAIAETWRQT